MKLELFKRDTCPFCQRVLKYIAETGRSDVLMRDTVQDPSNKEELIRIGGKDQVPCLMIDGQPLYESMDIIQWLSDHPEN